MLLEYDYISMCVYLFLIIIIKWGGGCIIFNFLLIRYIILYWYIVVLYVYIFYIFGDNKNKYI